MRSFPIILMVGLHYDSSDIGKTSHEAPMSGCFTPPQCREKFPTRGAVLCKIIFQHN